MSVLRTNSMPATTTPRKISAAIRILRRLKRSATTPAIGLVKNGANIRTTNRLPTAIPDSVSDVIKAIDAMRLNQSPSKLTICPNHSQRKSAFSRMISRYPSLAVLSADAVLILGADVIRHTLTFRAVELIQAESYAVHCQTCN